MVRNWVIFCVFNFCAGALITPNFGVRHLVGEPDYRAVKLRWEAFSTTKTSGDLPSFQVRYCELQSWGTQRCRTQPVPEPAVQEPDSNEVPGLSVSDEHSLLYSMDVEGLRMATTYSFEVRSATGRREDRADDNTDDNVIIIPTKGFSARATQCLPHASEIEVSTGPHFAGRITVEASDGERCTVDGEPENPRDTYILHIDHKACGSYVNETTVATYVIVQENLPILTHSTRRFLVLCSYQPETLTVRAGLSLPGGNNNHHHQHHHGKGHGYSESVDPQQDFNSVRRSRQLRPARLIDDETVMDKPKEIYMNEDHVTPLALLSVLAVIGLCSLILITFRWRRINRNLNIDDSMSIRSDLSISTDPEENLSQDNSLQINRMNPLYNYNNISGKTHTDLPKNTTEHIC